MRQPSAGGAGWPFPQAPPKLDVTKCHRDKLSRLATGGKGGRSARLLREGGLPSRSINYLRVDWKVMRECAGARVVFFWRQNASDFVDISG